MSACNDFRERLSRSIDGSTAGSVAGSIGRRDDDVRWHEHLLGCASCRDLLQAEEALDVVLSSLPAPKLPAELAERVLARLAGSRDDALDRLLDLDRGDAPGVDLSDRVLKGLATERHRSEELRRLDTLLAQVPAPEIPAELAGDVLGKLALERVDTPAAPPAPRFAFLRGGTAYAAYAAAASLIALVAWRFTRPGIDEMPARPDEIVDVQPIDAGGSGEPRRAPKPELPESPRSPGRGVGPAGAEPKFAVGPDAVDDAEAPTPDEVPDAELLASLDVLERWDLLLDDDVAVLLASVDPVEEELLDLALDDEAEEDEG